MCGIFDAKYGFRYGGSNFNNALNARENWSVDVNVAYLNF